MGLGLSIAKKIVDAHNGQILVRNLCDGEVGGDSNGEGVLKTKTGTCFTVIIPRDLQTPEMLRQTWAGQ